MKTATKKKLALDPKRQTKGDRTKLTIEDAARKLFHKTGYLNARVQDIANEAGLSNGAFYRYFPDKHAIMMSLVQSLLEKGFKVTQAHWNPARPMESVYIATTHYLNFYAENSDLFRILVEVSQTDDEVDKMWAKVTAETVKRIERMLERAQASKLVRENVDIPVAATSLIALTDQYAFLMFIAKRAPNRSIETVSEQLSELWCQAVFVRH